MCQGQKAELRWRRGGHGISNGAMKGVERKKVMQERRNRHYVPLVAIGADEKNSNGADENPEITTDRAPRRVESCSLEESKTWKEKVRLASRSKPVRGYAANQFRRTVLPFAEEE
jgi:hypothetical protein